MSVNEDQREKRIDFAGYFDLAKAPGSENPENLQDHELLTPLKDCEQRYPDYNQINEGGMKHIEAGTDAIIGREVAIARMRACNNSDDLELFLREGRITACLEHPNIMPVYDISLDDEGLPFFTMKLVRGENLAKILSKISKNEKYTEKYRLPQLLEIYMKICDAVAYAHSRGVLHLDLKPENIQISDYGEVLVCDWGLAKLLENADSELLVKDGVAGPLTDINRTVNGMVKGTPGYMAPEQADPGKKAKSVQTDIYSLGAILYSILTLCRPVTGDSSEDVIRKTVSGDFIEPRFRASDRVVPFSLNAVVCKAMATSPSERYDSVEALQTEIRAYQEGFATEAENAPFNRLLLLFFKRHAGLTLLTSMAVVVLTLVTTAFLNHIEQKQSEIEAQNIRLEEEQRKSEQAKFEKDKLTENAAAVLIEKAQNLLENNSYQYALQQVEKSLELKPDLEKALELKAIILTGSMRFTEAAETAMSMKSWTSQYFTNLASKYEPLLNKDGLLKTDDFIHLLLEIRDHRMLEEQGEYEKFKQRVSAYIENQLCRSTLKRYPLSDRLKMLEELLEITNPQAGPLNISVEHDGTIIKSLSLEDNPHLSRPDVLTGLPIQELNLQNTAVNDLEFTRKMPLISLNISNTSVHSLEPLSESPLRELKLFKTPVTDIKPIVRLPLRTLYLGSARVSPLNFINDLPYLEELYIPEGVYSQEEIKQLGDDFKVIVI